MTRRQDSDTGTAAPGPAVPDDDLGAAFDAGPRTGTASLRSGLASLFHDRRRIAGVLAAGLALTLAAAALAPRKYTAEAELLLRLGREYIYKPELGEAAGGGPVAYDLEQTLQAEARILASRDILDAVLDKMGDAQVFPALQESRARRWMTDTALPAVGLAWLWPGASATAPARAGGADPAMTGTPTTAAKPAQTANAAAAPNARATAGASAARSTTKSRATAPAAAAAPTPAELLARQARRAAALQQFSKALDADLLKGSNLMQVSFVHRDPQVAAAVLNEVVDAYLQRRSVIFASASRGSGQANFDARKAQLKAAEASLAELKRTRRIQAFGAEQTLLLAQRNGLEERRTESQLALARASGRAASLRDSLGGVRADVQLSSETQPSDAVEKARSLLLDLQLKERDLSAQFTDDSPAVQDVRADIARTGSYLQELLANPVRTVRSGRSPARDAVESDLLRTLADQQQARSGSLTLVSAQSAMDKRLAELAGSEAELGTLERERRLAEENFNAAAKLLRDETAATQLDRERRSNVSIVQAPRVPVVGRSLAAVILFVGCFASVCAALFTAFLSALWRDTFLTPEQAEQQLGLPVLASVQRGRA